jgi:hypothetical protein
MTNLEKFWTAIINLKSDVKLTVRGDEITSQEDFNNKIEWFVRAENGRAVTTKTNPHSEITWDLVEAEMIRLQAEYDAQDYARNRKEEYPSIEECVHAILDDDLENLQILRQVVKDKFPKENA